MKDVGQNRKQRQRSQNWGWKSSSTSTTSGGGQRENSAVLLARFGGASQDTIEAAAMCHGAHCPRLSTDPLHSFQLLICASIGEVNVLD